MAIRYERDDEIIPLALKRTRNSVANANRPTGTEIRQTADKVDGMSADVQEALEQAQQAIDDAANAMATSSGKNARRRGQTEPEPPPGGWVQGDQWIVDNEDGVPSEVRVWNGTEFVFEQLLAAELLVVSGGGVIRLADGVVTADAIASDAIDGMVITGATVQGGIVRQQGEYNQNIQRRFTLPRNVGAFTTFWISDDGKQSRSFIVPMDNKTVAWQLPNQPPSEVQSPSFEIAPRCINPATTLFENRSQVRIPDDFPVGVSVAVSIWVCSIQVAKNATINWHDGTSQTVSLPLGQWVKLSRTGVRSQEFLEVVNSINSYPLVPNSLAVADITFESSQGAVGRSELVTTDDGPALVFSLGADADSLVETGRVSPTEMNVAGTFINSDGITVQDDRAISSGGALVLAGQSVRVIGSEQTAFEGPVSFEDRVVLGGRSFGLIDSGTITNLSQFDILGLTGALQYEIMLTLPSASVANDLNIQLIDANGNPDLSTVYDVQVMQGAETAAAAAPRRGNNSWLNVLAAGRTDKTLRLTLMNLNAVERTVGLAEAIAWNAAGDFAMALVGLRHRSVKAFTGIRIITSTGTVTGRYEVRAS